MHLLHRIERYLRRSGTPPTRFGREAVRDPRLVHDLRRGREPGAAMVARVSAYLESMEHSGQARP
jgi:hypothetical protein